MHAGHVEPSPLHRKTWPGPSHRRLELSWLSKAMRFLREGQAVEAVMTRIGAGPDS